LFGYPNLRGIFFYILNDQFTSLLDLKAQQLLLLPLQVKSWLFTSNNYFILNELPSRALLFSSAALASRIAFFSFSIARIPTSRLASRL